MTVWRWLRANYRTIGVVLFVFFTFVSLYRSNTAATDAQNAVEISDSERAVRIDQICAVFERQHLEEVRQYLNTLDYLGQLTPEQEKEGINPFIIKQLPVTAKTAATDLAPDYCDEPGAAKEAKGAKPIGLPEPDPCVPGIPKSLGGDGVPLKGEPCKSAIPGSS